MALDDDDCESLEPNSQELELYHQGRHELGADDEDEEDDSYDEHEALEKVRAEEEEYQKLLQEGVIPFVSLICTWYKFY
jgi:hypothetical protein